MINASVRTTVLIPVLLVLLVGIAAMVVTVGAFSSNSTLRLTDELIEARVNEHANEFRAINDYGFATASMLVPVVEGIWQGPAEDKRQAIMDYYYHVLEFDENVFAVWTVWEPDALDGKDAEYVNKNEYHDETGRFVPYVYRDEGGIIAEALIDYENPAGDSFSYYLGAKQTEKTYLTDPYLYETSQGETITIYSIAIPVFDGGVFAGVVGMDINLADAVNVMDEVKILADGYVAIISPCGLIATSPYDDYLLESYKLTWLNQHAAGIDSILENGGFIKISGFSGITHKHTIGLIKGVMIGNTGRYWAVCGLVSESTVSAEANRLVLIAALTGLAVVLFAAITLLLLINLSLQGLPSLTILAENLSAGKIEITALPDASPTKNEIILLERSIIAGAYSRKVSEDIALRVKEGEFRAQEFISKFSVPFTQPYNFDELIDNALFDLRDFTKTDRAVILEFLPDSTLQCMHENVISGETPKIIGQHYAYAELKPMLDEADRTGCFYEKEAERYFEEHGVRGAGEKSFCVIPLTIEGERAGYLIFFAMFEQASWAEGEFRLATMAGSIIAGAYSIRKNDELKEEALKAKQASEAKSSFLSIMSHEMRTPLNAIIGMAAIGKDTNDTARKSYAIEKIADASTNLLSIINDVLDLAKIEANKIELSLVEYNIERMLQKATLVAKFRMDEKKQVFDVHMNPDVPYFIIGDDQRLSQVITNLLSNACKFTPEGGDIDLGISLVKEEAGICTLRFEVADNGIGISPEQQKKLFRAFTQAESGTSRSFGGTGLGLALSKRIVELMGGEIYVESVLGEGSRFIFTIKVERGEQKLLSLLNADLDREKLKILVVEKNEYVQKHFMRTFDTLAIHCDVAADCPAALGLVGENGRYDVYFIDWRIFEAGSPELATLVKGQKSGSESVVAIISGDWASVKDMVLESGADSCIIRPLFATTIIERINECLASKNTETAFMKAPRDQFSGKRILVVEDVEINREIILSLLDGMGLVIEEAENGLEALEKVTAAPGHYDLIFMDVQMPKMDGVEAAKRIRALPYEWTAAMPIVAMTANVFREDVEKYLAAGMNEHIGKPVDINEVLIVIKKYLAQQHA